MRVKHWPATLEHLAQSHFSSLHKNLGANLSCRCVDFLSTSGLVSRDVDWSNSFHNIPIHTFFTPSRIALACILTSRLLYRLSANEFPNIIVLYQLPVSFLGINLFLSQPRLPTSMTFEQKSCDLRK